MRIDGENRLDDLVGVQTRGVHAVHRELGIGVIDPVARSLDESVPAGTRLGPLSEPASALVFAARQLVANGLRQIGRQTNVETDAESAVGGEAASEVTLHYDRNA
ncbi:hypothetical protein [Streptomyces sp. A0958]|uniref:hypothetical protein n=1 Tax=Streptomyces sp. A0958 TaxID=2563101 RepID=UPI001444AA8B|nr:hypothetical protein [Streptomyces sp. A0958]